MSVYGLFHGPPGSGDTTSNSLSFSHVNQCLCISPGSHLGTGVSRLRSKQESSKKCGGHHHKSPAESLHKRSARGEPFRSVYRLFHGLSNTGDMASNSLSFSHVNHSLCISSAFHNGAEVSQLRLYVRGNSLRKVASPNPYKGSIRSHSFRLIPVEKNQPLSDPNSAYQF